MVDNKVILLFRNLIFVIYNQPEKVDGFLKGVYRVQDEYLVEHLYLVVFPGFNTDQNDLVAEKSTGIRALIK